MGREEYFTKYSKICPISKELCSCNPGLKELNFSFGSNGEECFTTSRELRFVVLKTKGDDCVCAFKALVAIVDAMICIFCGFLGLSHVLLSVCTAFTTEYLLLLLCSVLKIQNSVLSCCSASPKA